MTPSHDDGTPASRLTHLTEHVRSDPNLTPTEQETAIRWDADTDTATIDTEERTIILNLLRSSVARIHTLRVSDGDRFGAGVEPHEHSDGDVTGLTATVPVGAITVKSKPRTENHRTHVVSTHQPDGAEP